MDNDLLSKKELLRLTGISYGQLYRWKRQKLIPETWFIKQSSFTGQETFFPQEKILERVRLILELKDQYSLEELANVLSPESTSQVFTSEEIREALPLPPVVLELFERIFGKSRFVFRELLFMQAIGEVLVHHKLEVEELEGLVTSIIRWLPELERISYRLLLCRRDGRRFGLLLEQSASLFLDCQTETLQVIELEESAKNILKLREV